MTNERGAAGAASSPAGGDALTVLHIVRQFHPGIGGLENFVEQLARRQAALGHDVRVVTLNRIFGDPRGAKLPSSELRDGIRVTRVPFAGSRRYPIAPRMLKPIREADIVHVHGVDFFCDYLAATAWLHRKPMVLSTHGGFFHTPFLRRLKQAYFALVTRASLSRYRAVVACSEGDRRTFASIAGPRLTTIPNPVDVEKFAGRADPHARAFIYFGRLAPNKELPRLIAWFAGLAARSDWRLIIAGKPMGMETAELLHEARSAGIGDRVEVHDTPSDQELSGLISRSAVYCCASSYEGFGLAAIEAASAGLYPVLSDIAAFRDNLQRLGFGTLVDFEDSATWGESYGRFEDGLAAFRNEFSSDRLEARLGEFGWSEGVLRFEDVYARVLGRSTRRIGPVAVGVLDRQSATAAILEHAAKREPMMVTFCNAHTVNLASRDSKLRESLESATILNDGVGVDMASGTLFGSPFPDNLNGTDFIPQLLAAVDEPLRVYFLGAAPGVAEAAARAAESRFPRIEAAGSADGFFREEQGAAIVDAIRESGANLILVGMGQPRQEQWASRHFRDIAGPVICVGALFDFLAGRIPRAPAWMRKLRIEWAFRLFKEPRRLAGRYVIGNAAFLCRVMRQKWFGTRI